MSFTPEVEVPFGQNHGTLNPPKFVKIEQALAIADFTDVDTTGYVDLAVQLPAGAIPLGWKAVVSAGFAGAILLGLVGVSIEMR